ncbi:aspartate kinase [Streptomyces griseocarneus]|nr:aspartate kinase [Streptomyces griseocarneus]
MTLIVQKYGGSSVADPDRIRGVAERVATTRKDGQDVVVVVSAMGASTDDLLALADRVAAPPFPPRETDLLLSAGERISSALLAMALESLGVPARALTGAQAGIATTADHGRASITDVAPGRIREVLDAGCVPVVAGFQGRAAGTLEVTTLGRGGSDTTAVALAAALNAGLCEICTDVDGVYTADPRIVPEARMLDRIGYEAMRQLAAGGAQVLATPSVAYAQCHRVSVRVRSSHGTSEGTLLSDDPTGPGEVNGAVIGVAHHRAVRIGVAAPDELADRLLVAERILRAAEGDDHEIDVAVCRPDPGTGELSFVVHTDQAAALAAAVEEIGPGPRSAIRRDENLGRISVIGPASVSRCCAALMENGITIETAARLRHGVRILCGQDRLDDAVRTLHTVLGLGTPAMAGAAVRR